jgi:RNA polymerase sigma factor (sigma-70 family)
MSETKLNPVIRHIRKLAETSGDTELADAVLLRRFARQRDENAFTMLVRRHGRLVLGVCRQVLGNQQDAEDAFQATFLILARRAGSIRRGKSLGSWLYRVAYHVATRAGIAMNMRRSRERNGFVAESQAASASEPHSSAPAKHPAHTIRRLCARF